MATFPSKLTWIEKRELFVIITSQDKKDITFLTVLSLHELDTSFFLNSHQVLWNVIKSVSKTRIHKNFTTGEIILKSLKLPCRLV